MEIFNFASINFWGPFANPEKRLDAVINFINLHNFDFVVFQEIVKDEKKVFETLTNNTSLKFSVLMQNPNGEGMYEGCAILSKIPFQSNVIYRLPDSNPSRFLLHAKLVNTNFSIFNTHLSYHNEETLSQLEEILSIVSEEEKSLLLGDFNLDLKPVKITFAQHGLHLASTLDPTWPVNKQMFETAWQEKTSQKLEFIPQEQTLDGIFSKNIKIESKALKPVYKEQFFSDHMVMTGSIIE